MAKEMILKRLKILDELQKELNGLKEVYDDTLENDKGYQEVQEKVNKVKEETKDKKAKVMDNNLYKNMTLQIREKRQEISENKEALSMELIEHYRENGTLEIEDADGNIKRMKVSARLVN